MTDRLLSESAVIAAVQGERLCDNTGCPTDIAYEQALSDAIAAISALPDASNWQPIETAPKDGARILLYGTQRKIELLGAFTGVISGYWDAVDDSWCSDASTWIGRFIDATHWQHRPPPPEQDT